MQAQPEDNGTAHPPDLNQENQRQNTSTLKLSATINIPQDRPNMMDLAEVTSLRTALSEPRRLCFEDTPWKPEKKRLHGSLDPNRTAQWLRGLLGSSQGPYCSSFTQLPEKRYPRRVAHDDYPEDRRRALATRVTTYSDEIAADTEAMDQAMKNLETLLGKALEIANEAAEHERSWSNLPEQLIADDSHPPAIRGRLAKEVSSANDETIGMATPPQCNFVGATGTSGHGCELLPLRAIVRRGLAELDKRSRMARGPTLPERASSLVNRQRFKRYSDAEPPQPDILPMILAESQQPPQGLHPSPHSFGTTSAGVLTPRTNFCSLDGSASDDAVEFSVLSQHGKEHYTSSSGKRIRHHHGTGSVPTHAGVSERKPANKRVQALQNVDLRRASHQSIEGREFSLTKSYRGQPIARDWSPARKRFVAMVVCLGTALTGLLVGIYAGIVPAVQYYIADTHHVAILGNVAMYLGMALPTFFCWPLSVLHGRKAYILSGLTIAMPLLFPQAITVSVHRSPRTNTWRWALLLPRGLMGISMGFANMNFHSTLTDLFGASLMSSNPHQEVVDHHDVRRHGGGLGVWLGVWTWCFTGSLGIGFLVGALIIDSTSPTWGFYISIMLIAVVLILNIITPEARRSVWRRSVAETTVDNQISRRVARGEIMMHRVKDGSIWWGQEVWHGTLLSLEMLRQPGFAVVAVYSAWIYAQVVLVIVVSTRRWCYGSCHPAPILTCQLLGSLTSKYYYFRASYVGAAVSSVAIGALAAVPFQKANLFSRARYQPSKSNRVTFEKQLTWTSHLVRRAVFTIFLPIAGVMYAVVSFGPPVHPFFPCFFAALIGFLSCLAISECNGIVMETWDCSDLQPGMAGRSKNSKSPQKRTNYSVFPRVQAGYAIIHSLGFVFAAGATGIGGIAERHLGQRTASALVASILLLLTLLLLTVLVRFRKVEIIPHSKTGEMDRWTEERRANVRSRASAIARAKATGHKDLSHIPTEEIDWRPLIIGNPSEKSRRMNIVEFGSLTRWTEIRRRNRLIDEGAYMNRTALELAREELGHRSQEMLDDLARGGAMMMDMARNASKRSMRSKGSHESSTDDEGSPKLPSHGLAHSGAGHGHNHPGSPLAEGESVMGLAVPEESEGSSSVVEQGDADEDYLRDRSQDHASHATPKVQPHAGFEMQNT